MTAKETRPYVLTNYATTLDGKLAPPDRRVIRYTSAEDRRRMDQLRSEVDAILIGGETLRADDPPLRPRMQEHLAARSPDRRTPLLNVVLSRSLQMNLSGVFFRDDGTEKWIITTAESNPDLRAAIAAKAQVRVLGESDVDLDGLMGELLLARVTRLLVEGGGRVNSLFFARDWVDEMYITMCPLVIGGRDAPTGCDGPGMPAEIWPRFRLAAAEPVGNEVFLRYVRER